MPATATPPPRTLRFLHIPKTAGTTMVHILRTQFRGAARFEFSGDADADARRFAALPEQERTRIRLFAGHAPIRTGVPQADACPVITLLREPIARVQSFCRHVSEGKSPYLRERFPPERFDLDAFLWSDTAELSNLQARMLINTGSCDAPWPDDVSEEQAARLALGNLCCRVTHFGIQEHFHESVMRFAAAFGWSRLRYSVRNPARGGRRLVFQAHHLQRIAELNRVDSEVYRQAEARFRGARSLREVQREPGRWGRAASVLAHLFG